MKGKSIESWEEHQDPGHVQLPNNPATTDSQTPCWKRKTVPHWFKLWLMVVCHLQPKAYLMDPGVPALCSESRSTCFYPFVLIIALSPWGQSLGIVLGRTIPFPGACSPCKTMTHFRGSFWPHTFIPEWIPWSIPLYLPHLSCLFLSFVKCPCSWPGYRNISTHSPLIPQAPVPLSKVTQENRANLAFSVWLFLGK